MEMQPTSLVSVPDRSSAQGLEQWVEIGKIVGSQGLRGEVRVYPASDFPERFEQPGQRWLLRPQAHQPEPIALIKGRFLEGKGLYVVQLQGISDRSAADTLQGSKLLVSATDRPHLEADEFMVADLVGLVVVDQATQADVGTVVSVIPAGNDLLEVKTAQDKLILIPFVEAIVPIVDLSQQRIEINPPIGLIE
jgi:16S rRNA processing protein RimM